MLHLDPTSPMGLADAALHAGPILAPVAALGSLIVAALRGGR